MALVGYGEVSSCRFFFSKFSPGSPILGGHVHHRHLTCTDVLLSVVQYSLVMDGEKVVFRSFCSLCFSDSRLLLHTE